MKPLYAIIILLNDQEPFFHSFFPSLIFYLFLTQLIPADYYVILNYENWVVLSMFFFSSVFLC